MKYMIIIVALLVIACNHAGTHEEGHSKEHTPAIEASALQLNNGNKWKADEATHKNVAALAAVVNNKPAFNHDAKQFTSQVEARLETLVKECKMKGPDHDALHQWLQPVMADTKQLKKGENEQEAYSKLVKDVAAFNEYFE